MKYFRRKTQLLQQNFFFGFLAVGLFLALPALTLAAPGDLDPTFGTGGRITTGFSFANASGVAVLADGKIVVAGTDQSLNSAQFVLARYHTDGSLDTSFGNGGKVSISVGQFNYAYGIAIQADGKIVVAGYAGVFGPIRDFAVVRYETNGSLDTSFDGDGKVIIDMGDDNFANDLAIQPDGKIVVVGGSGVAQSRNYAFAVARLNSDGSLDASFDGDGRVITSLGSFSDVGARAVALQQDGKIVAAGQSGSGNFATADFALVRYHSDGSLDASFDGDGKLITAVSNGYDAANGVVVQPDGRIVAAGSISFSRVAVVRYNANGSLDASFDGDGIAVTPVGYGAGSVAIQSNGKIVVTGGSGDDFLLVRYNPNGSLDTSFGGDGIVTTNFGTDGYAGAGAVAIQPDGKIVAAGSYGLDGEFAVIAVARYIGDSASPNPIDDAQFFVRQHYLDFLSREPEPGEPWSAILNDCPDPFNFDPNSPSARCDRITVSAAFFGSPEFRLKGFYVFTFYRVAFDRLADFSEISADMQSVTGQTPADTFARRTAFPVSFTQRQEFRARFDPLSDAAFVAALLDRYGLQSITTPDPLNPEGGQKVRLTRADLTRRLGDATLTRARLLRAVVESDEVSAAEFNRAFVAMQYYGYLRRTPEEAGYNDWLNHLTAHPTDFRTMVHGFVNSVEYRMRFGQP